MTNNKEEAQPIPEKPKSDIDLVRETREALKAENDALESEMRRQQELRAQTLIQGRGVTNELPKEKTQAELDLEEAEAHAKRIFGR